MDGLTIVFQEDDMFIEFRPFTDDFIEKLFGYFGEVIIWANGYEESIFDILPNVK